MTYEYYNTCRVRDLFVPYCTAVNVSLEESCLRPLHTAFAELNDAELDQKTHACRYSILYGSISFNGMQNPEVGLMAPPPQYFTKKPMWICSVSPKDLMVGLQRIVHHRNSKPRHLYCATSKSSPLVHFEISPFPEYFKALCGVLTSESGFHSIYSGLRGNPIVTLTCLSHLSFGACMCI